MYKLLVLLMISAVAWSSIGCGGPGKPVNKSADLRDRAGGGAADDSSNQDSQNLNKDESKAADDDSKSAESPDGTDTKEPGEGDDEAGKPEKEADKNAATVASSRARLRPGRPAGLGIATGAAPKTGDKEDELEQRKENEKPSDATSGDTPPAGIENEAPVEKHRFTFFERANQAFSTENETEAFQYLYAHAIAEDNALNEHPIAWYTGINEPRLGLRWGVGVDYSPGSFSGDPPKFGDNEGARSSAGGSGNNTGDIGGRDVSDRLPGGRRIPRPPANSGQTPGSEPSGDNPTELLLYYAGDFGDLLLQRIELRRTNTDFYWGKALFDIDPTKVFEEKDSSTAGAPRGNSSGRDRDRNSGGGSGLQMEDAMDAPPPTSDAGDNSSADNNRLPGIEIPGFEPEFRADPTSLVPGAIMLGLGNHKELLERARAHGLDLIAVFDVTIQFTSKDEAKNVTMLTIINVKTGEEVAKSRRLNTTAYSNALEGNRENPIELELDKLFPEATDKDYKCSKLPTITSDIASKRVQSLLEGKLANPLPVLAEIKHYMESGLITKDEYIAAAEALIGAGNARKLVDGEIEEREEALHDWLPGQYTVDVGSSSEGFR